MVTTALGASGAGLYVVTRTSTQPTNPALLLGPILSLTGLIAVIGLLMAIFRNYAILRNLAQGEYYREYKNHAPPDWVERPARTFNNLLQIPNLFYVVCTLMIVFRQADQAQLTLAWLFVALRVLHAGIYIGLNYLPARFGSWAAGDITLFVLWTRFADQVWFLL